MSWLAPPSKGLAGRALPLQSPQAEVGLEDEQQLVGALPEEPRSGMACGCTSLNDRSTPACVSSGSPRAARPASAGTPQVGRAAPSLPRASLQGLACACKGSVMGPAQNLGSGLAESLVSGKQTLPGLSRSPCSVRLQRLCSGLFCCLLGKGLSGPVSCRGR